MTLSDQRYTFEQWTLDCSRGALIAGTGEIALRPKCFEVLRYLIESAGRLVSRDDVLNAVWPGVTVTEESLTQCVSEIRQALGDAGQRVIRTVPKRGYIFTSPVTSHDRGVDAHEVSVLVSPEQSASAATAGPSCRPRMIEGPSVAVLPFANLSGDASQEYLSDGITEDIINGLSYFSDLSVIARNSSFAYKGRPADVREIGEQLGVRYLVEGSARRFGDRIRITAQLVDSQSGVRRWAERFDRALGDIFAVQDEITQSVVPIIVAHLGSAEGERTSGKPPSSWTAYDLLMQGDQALRVYEQSWVPQLLYEARRRFAEAHKVDPGNARICAMLGHTYVRAFADPMAQELGDSDVLKHGYELVSRAVGLDPNLPLPRAQLGWALFWMHQPDAAVREYERAFVLNPNFTDWRFPVVLVYAGSPGRALDVVRAHLRLDPYGGALSKMKLTKVCPTKPSLQYETKKSRPVRCDSCTSRSS
jgi:TolB-like protein